MNNHAVGVCDTRKGCMGLSIFQTLRSSEGENEGNFVFPDMQMRASGIMGRICFRMFRQFVRVRKKGKQEKERENRI